MKKLALAAVMATVGTAAFAGTYAEPVMEAPVIVEETGGSSAGGWVVPVLLLLLVAAAVSAD